MLQQTTCHPYAIAWITKWVGKARETPYNIRVH